MSPISPKQVLGALAAVAVVVAGFLEWADFTDLGAQSGKGTDVPAEFLIDHTVGDGSPSIVLLLAIAAALIGIGVFVAQAHRYSTIVGGVGAIVVVGLFTIQVQSSLDDLPSNINTDNVFHYLGIGVFVALAGGIAGVAAGFMPSRSTAATTPPPAPAA